MYSCMYCSYAAHHFSSLICSPCQQFPNCSVFANSPHSVKVRSLSKTPHKSRLAACHRGKACDASTMVAQPTVFICLANCFSNTVANVIAVSNFCCLSASAVGAWTICEARADAFRGVTQYSPSCTERIFAPGTPACLHTSLPTSLCGGLALAAPSAAARGVTPSLSRQYNSQVVDQQSVPAGAITYTPGSRPSKRETVWPPASSWPRHCAS